MNVMVHPALTRLLAEMGNEIRVAQVLIRRVGAGFELRHAADAGTAADRLRLTPVADLRLLSQTTAAGAFRPLHAAPDLRAGWCCVAHSPAELEAALEHLYPGFLADWLAVQTGPPPATHYREFTARQTGMYRLTAKLGDALVAEVVQAACQPRFCLKRRYWTAPGADLDQPDEKSLIPCLEPCPVLLEFARKRMRIFQESTIPANLSPTDVRSLLAALEIALAHPPAGLRAADFAAPQNPRHLALLHRRLAAQLPPENDTSAESSGE